ncbi:hypothetical protein EV360DRAFT_67785 [Lentinula raphanica]|nr:hypothetical protein EV360DRAFT_67785 [Lentinula raphanica]
MNQAPNQIKLASRDHIITYNVTELDIIPYHVWLKRRHQDSTNALRPNSPIRDEDEVWYLYISLRHTFQAVKTGDSKWQLVKGTSPAQSGTLKLGEIAARAKEDAKEIFNKILGIEGDDQFQTLNNVIEFLRGNLKFGDRALPEHTRTPDNKPRTLIPNRYDLGIFVRTVFEKIPPKIVRTQG